MSSEWTTTTLGEVSSWMSGGTPKKDMMEYWNGDIPWISANSMHSTRYSDSDLRITPDGLKSGSRLAPKNSVLLLVRGSALHNRIPVGIATRDVAFNQDVKALIADKTVLNSWYLLFWLMGQERYLLDSVVEYTGIGAGKLDTKRMQGLEFLLPPLDEQETIVALVKAIDDRITLLRETNTTLEAIAQALFKSWFVDFDPVRAKQEGREPEGMDADTAALFPDSFEESELGLVPKGWRVGTIADLAKLNPESWTAKTHPETVRYIDLANAKNNEIDAIMEYVFDEAPSRARRVLRAGDSVIGTVRPGNRSFAYIYQAPSNLTGSTGFAVLRPKNAQNSEFLFIAATQDSSIDHLAHVADGGAYPAVRPEVVANIQSILPSEEVMNAFHNIVAPLFARVGENQTQAQTLATLRDTLLPRLISGQLRLPDVEGMVGEVLK